MVFRAIQIYLGVFRSLHFDIDTNDELQGPFLVFHALCPINLPNVSNITGDNIACNLRSLAVLLLP